MIQYILEEILILIFDFDFFEQLFCLIIDKPPFALPALNELKGSQKTLIQKRFYRIPPLITPLIQKKIQNFERGHGS